MLFNVHANQWDADLLRALDIPACEGTALLWRGDFQNARQLLQALARHLKRELTPEEGAAAKLWHTELQWEVMDKCLQLHGGAGYMNEYPIARMWRGARVTRIFGGTNEIMKELIGRKL